MLRLSDFVTCRKRYYYKSGRGLCLSFGTLWEEAVYNIHLSDTNRQIFMLSWLSDFVVSSTNLYIWSSGVYNLGLQHNLKLKFSVCENSSDNINTIFKHCYA